MAADERNLGKSRAAAAVLLGALAVGAAPDSSGGDATEGDPRPLAAGTCWDQQFEASFAPGVLTDAPTATSAIICDD